ncbi:hypothetical protein BJ508DRAFT_40257 [Ascobolus immersus RN42]|uniref:Uncharacterized protein n=1 Tax=Ascobolus immersus RN42 TaxID=1160509 RepID=A0A3N4HJP2_ASCIM|nr:hypothetical protein BJ508DRAFT_40257 [Ascobolus immersus RN42]
MSGPDSAGSASADMEWSDWIQTTSSLIACFAALVALFTVYQALVQHSERAQMLNSAHSTAAIGPWRKETYQRKLTQVGIPVTRTPYINLTSLVEGETWNPSVNLPRRRNNQISTRDSDVERGPDLDASYPTWPSFLEALGVSPSARGDSYHPPIYSMRSQAELVNGKVPMVWSGKDIVALCSALGFQTPVTDLAQMRECHRRPMPLPMQWSGPLGFLRFTESPFGCVLEYRSRVIHKNQIDKEIHDFYGTSSPDSAPIRLVERLWNAINGMSLDEDRSNKTNPEITLLYLGGADRKKRSAMEASSVKPDAKDASSHGPGAVSNSSNDIEKDVGKALELCKNRSMGDGEVLTRAVLDKHVLSVQANEVQRLEAHTAKSDLRNLKDAKNGFGPSSKSKGSSDMPEFMKGLLQSGGGGNVVTNSNGKPFQILSPCPALFTNIIEGEMAGSRGLDLSRCITYHRRYVSAAEATGSQDSFPYSMGRLYMDLTLLKYIKRSVLNLYPDGFFYTPGLCLAQDTKQIWMNPRCLVKPKTLESLVQGAGDNTMVKSVLFSETVTTSLVSIAQDPSDSFLRITNAIRLCNILASNRLAPSLSYTITDMRALGAAHRLLREGFAMSPEMKDLTWALVYSATLLGSIAKFFRRKSKIPIHSIILRVRAERATVFWDGRDSTHAHANSTPNQSIVLPLVADADFTCRQVLEVYLCVLITAFWLSKKVVSDVSIYDAGMPRSLLMC